MLTVLAVVGVLVVLFVAGVVATREDQALVPAPEERADVALPERALRASELEQVRFGVAVRGYRMSEVDAVLERLSRELADRDARLEALSAGQEASADAGRNTYVDDPLAYADPHEPVAFPDVLPAEPTTSYAAVAPELELPEPELPEPELPQAALPEPVLAEPAGAETVPVEPASAHERNDRD